MRPSPRFNSVYDCFYINPVGGLVTDYGHSYLHCEDG